MRNTNMLLVALSLAATQVVPAKILPATASTAAPSAVVGTPTISLGFASQSPQPLVVHNTRPDFDQGVMLRVRAWQQSQAEQAAKAAEEARKAAAAKAAAARTLRLAAARPAPVIGAVTGDVWYRLRMCESGNTYNRNSGNGYYGAYQYNISTWANYMGYARADLAPPDVQDAKARDTQARRGWSPWPACASKLGLL